MQIADRKSLLDTLDDRLSAEEVREIVFDLDLDWNNLAGEDTKRGKLRSLIEYHERRDCLTRLMEVIAARRPDILNAPAPPPPAAQPKTLSNLMWANSGEDWLDFVTMVATMVALMRLFQGDTEWTAFLLLVAALAGGLRSWAMHRSTIWREPRWRPLAQIVLIGIPAVILVCLVGYHLFLRRQVLIYLISLPLAGLAGRVIYHLYKQVWRPTE